MFCLNFRPDVNQTLQLHLHRWIHFLLTGFDPVWPEPVCAYRTSFVLVKPGNQEARKEISALELTANFYSIIQNFFFPSYSVSLVKVVCHLQKVKENPVEKWIGHCFSCRSGEKCTEAINRPSEKVVLSFPIGMFQTEISVLFVKPFLKYQFQAFARGLPAIGKHDSTIKSGTHKIYRCWISLIIYPNHNPTSLIAHVNGKQIKIQGHPTRT